MKYAVKAYGSSYAEVLTGLLLVKVPSICALENPAVGKALDEASIILKIQCPRFVIALSTIYSPGDCSQSSTLLPNVQSVRPVQWKLLTFFACFAIMS